MSGVGGRVLEGDWLRRIEFVVELGAWLLEIASLIGKLSLHAFPVTGAYPY